MDKRNSFTFPKNIKWIITDFDGILTDGCVYIDAQTCNEQKKLSFKDIMGMSLATKAGINIAIISGENNNIIDYVAKKFNIQEIHKGIRDKKSVMEKLISKYNLTEEEMLYIGDDVNDIPALRLVKYAYTPNDGNYKVKNLEHIQITKNKGGEGAFREIIDALLETRQQ